MVLAGVLLAYALRWAPGVDARLHASGAQTAFRFNSYVALALAERRVRRGSLVPVLLPNGLAMPVAYAAAMKLGYWVEQIDIQAELVRVESEHSAMAVCIGGAAGGGWWHLVMLASAPAPKASNSLPRR